MGKVCTFHKGYGISKDNLSNDGTPCILYGELYTTYKTAIARCIKSKTSLDPTTLFHSRKNDVIIPCSGETSEDIATSVCIPYDDILLGGDLTVIRCDLDGAFLSNQINSVRKYDIARIAQGKSIVHLQADELKKIYIAYPTIEEQQKISGFIDKIDELIEVQKKIISKYESLIKGIRHHVFSLICGERHSSLGSFLEEYSEKNVANNLQSVAVGKYGIRKREEIYSKELSADYSKNKVIRKNTLIIGMGSTQIDIGILTTDDCYCVSPAYTTYRIRGVNSFYLQEYLIELNPLLSVRYMITSARQGKAVNKEDLMKHLMTIHSENEQKEICQCFENLYSRLQIEKEMLSALQKQKAFLLQSMFI
jgi:type I restriction enzyme S subunit